MSPSMLTAPAQFESFLKAQGMTSQGMTAALTVFQHFRNRPIPASGSRLVDVDVTEWVDKMILHVVSRQFPYVR